MHWTSILQGTSTTCGKKMETQFEVIANKKYITRFAVVEVHVSIESAGDTWECHDFARSKLLLPLESC